MGYKEAQAARHQVALLKHQNVINRDKSRKEEEADRKLKHFQVEDNHKLAVMQIQNAYIEEDMRLNDYLADLLEGAQK